MQHRRSNGNPSNIFISTLYMLNTFWGNKNLLAYFLSFLLQPEMAQVVEIHTHGRQGLHLIDLWQSILMLQLSNCSEDDMVHNSVWGINVKCTLLCKHRKSWKIIQPQLGCKNWCLPSQQTWHIGCSPTGVDAREYRKTSSISRTKFQNLNGFRLVLQLSLLNALESGKSRMKM